MVKAKNQPESKYWLTEALGRIDREHPIIATRYYVVEITPSKRIRVGDGHGGSDWDWTVQRAEIVSPYYDSKVSAEEWLNQHEPDEGKTLEVREQHKRRTVTERWW